MSQSKGLPVKRSSYNFEANRNAMAEGRLYESEVFWRDHCFWLEERGYLLRARYDPYWVATWRVNPKINWLFREDGQTVVKASLLMDATRIADGKQVAIKKVITANHPDEVHFARSFCSKQHASNVSNHCVPIYDVFDVPDVEGTVLMVMPLLFPCLEPDFNTIGEFVGFVGQVYEGLQFLHSLNVAHNDVKWDNVMMDSLHLYDEPVHPTRKDMKRNFRGPAKKPRTRTERPVNYYLVDFGRSRLYDRKSGPPRQYSGQKGYGVDKSVPEFRIPGYYDPFLIDVYRAGNLIREIKSGDYHPNPGGTEKKKILGLDFLEPLLQDMCHADPEKRPTMGEAVVRFTKIVNALSSWELRSRIRRLGDVDRLGQSTVHWATQIVRIAKRVPSIPTPPPRV